jgi:hypothetical protein
MPLRHKPESLAAARFMDTLPDETRLYLLEMVYRVAGVEPPPPPQRSRKPPGNVLSFTSVRSASG